MLNKKSNNPPSPAPKSQKKKKVKVDRYQDVIKFMKDWVRYSKLIS